MFGKNDRANHEANCRNADRATSISDLPANAFNALYYENHPDPVFIESLGGRILGCNSAACREYGFARAELIGMTVFDLVPHETAMRIPDVIVAQLQAGGAAIDAYGKRRDGSVFPTRVFTKLVEHGGEQVMMVIVATRPTDES